VVDPIFRVVFFVFAGCWFSSREAIGAAMLVGRDMGKFEVE
jgi:hypothetical protein